MEKHQSKQKFTRSTQIFSISFYSQKPECEKQRAGEFVTFEKIRRLKMLANKLIKEMKDFNLFTFKFHVLDHIMEDISQFGAINFSDVSLFEHFNYVIKNFIKMSSIRHGSTLEEAVRAMNASVAIEQRRITTGGGVRKATLVRDGRSINLVEIETSTFASLAPIDNY